MAFRKFGTFRTPHGWLTTTGDGEVIQRGTKKGDTEATTGASSQFEVKVVEGSIKIKRGTVIAGIGNMITPNPPDICNRQFYIQNLWGSPLSSTFGTEPDSEFINDNGGITLPSSPIEGTAIGIWIARDIHAIGSYGRLTTQQGFPWLIADEWIGPLEADTRPWGTDGCDMLEWYEIEDLWTQILGEQYFYLKKAEGGSSPHFALKNYNCQRFRIADVIYESGEWNVYQYWQGTVTLPNPLVYKGRFWVIDPDSPATWPTWRDDPEKETEQTNWETAMQTYDKGYAYPSYYETIP